MEREGIYRPVGFGGAVVNQFRLLWASRRPLLMMIGLLGVLALSGQPWSDNPMARLFTAWPVWMLVIGPLWAFAVWHNEGPSNRLYFWSHPVSRSGHALARFAAGAAWLVTLIALLIVAGALFAVFDGEAAQFGEVAAIGWLGLFTGPLLLYVVITVLALPSDYPVRWFLGILFGIPITLTLLDEWLDLDRLVEILLKPLGAEWGLGPAIVAPFAMAMQRLDSVVTGSVHRVANPFDLETWAIAMPLWLLFWTGIVVLLARWHPDRFPRWRRG